MELIVLCRCSACGIEDRVMLDRHSREMYSIVGDDYDVELNSLDDVTDYTDLDFGITFVGGDSKDPDNYKLLCGNCREEVQKVEEEIATIRAEKISTALKELAESYREEKV